MSLLKRRLMMALLGNGGAEGLEKIFEAEFTLGTTITTSSITTITTLDTGLAEGDLDEGEILIAEIRMLEDLETEDDTLVRQLERFEFLQIGSGFYSSAGYSAGNPTYMKANSEEQYTLYMAAATGVFISAAGKYLSTLTISGRSNGIPSPVAGCYQLLLYKTGFNSKHDHRE